MIIAAIAISVASIALSSYSTSVIWRWNRERNRLSRQFRAAIAKGGHPTVLKQ